MVGGVVANPLRNLADLQVRVGQIVHCLRHAQPFYQTGEIMPGVLLDQRTKVWFAVVEQFRQGRKGQVLVIVLYVLVPIGW